MPLRGPAEPATQRNRHGKLKGQNGMGIVDCQPLMIMTVIAAAFTQCVMRTMRG